MKDVLDKITSYNLFNFLLPGILFVILVEKFTIYSLIQKDIIIGAFEYYFIGLVISRFGSLIIEPILKKVEFLKFTDYKKFVIASQKDIKIDLLSQENNMYRSFCAMFILLFILKCYEFIEIKYQINTIWSLYILFVLLLVLFIISYKKQTKYISKRIEAYD